jgi:cellulose synthase/poly-beta-1,6-N-acetylglucosamine synthase-like glycosyltransferase
MQIFDQFLTEYEKLTSGIFDLPVMLFLVFAGVWFIQMLYYWLFYARLAFYKKRYPSKGKPPVSVVIAARDEYLNLQQNLPKILEQDYPDFEVIVVNNDSTDDSLTLLKSLNDKYEHLKIINVERNLNFFKGKKFPLSLGIRSAKHELLLLTDADCKPYSKDWIASMTSPMTTDSDIVLGFGGYGKGGGIAGFLMRFENFFIALQYLSFSLAGLTYMGVGRNLAYKRSLFFKQKGFVDHYNVASGDDDLFINKAARKRKVAIVVHRESQTESRPMPTLRKWFIQKRRHLSSSGRYRFIHKFLLSISFVSQLILFVLLTLLISLKIFVVFTLILFVLRFLSQVIIFNLAGKRLGLKKIFVLSFLSEIFLLLWYLILGISNLIRKPVRWR